MTPTEREWRGYERRRECSRTDLCETQQVCQSPTTPKGRFYDWDNWMLKSVLQFNCLLGVLPIGRREQLEHQQIHRC